MRKAHKPEIYNDVSEIMKGLAELIKSERASRRRPVGDARVACPGSMTIAQLRDILPPGFKAREDGHQRRWQAWLPDFRELSSISRSWLCYGKDKAAILVAKEAWRVAVDFFGADPPPAELFDGYAI